MREQDKPFILYKGKRGVRIEPRNVAGWRASIIWMLAIAPLCGAFIWAINRFPGTQAMVLLNILFLGAMTVWAILMYRWMKARSEIVDMEELLKIKREQDSASRKR